MFRERARLDQKEAALREQQRLQWERWCWEKRAEELLTFSDYDIGVHVEIAWTQGSRRIGRITGFNPNTKVKPPQILRSKRATAEVKLVAVRGPSSTLTAAFFRRLYPLRVERRVQNEKSDAPKPH